MGLILLLLLILLYSCLWSSYISISILSLSFCPELNSDSNLELSFTLYFSIFAFQSHCGGSLRVQIPPACSFSFLG